MKIKIILTLITAMFFTGCAKKTEDADLRAVMKSIAAAVHIEKADILPIVGDKALAKRYGIPLDKVEDGFAYANDGDLPDEVLIIKAKEPRYVNDIEHALETEVTGLLNAFESDDIKEYEKIMGHILKAKGTYVFLAVTDDNAEVEKLFDMVTKD